MEYDNVKFYLIFSEYSYIPCISTFSKKKYINFTKIVTFSNR